MTEGSPHKLMDATPKELKSENPNPNGHWTVVLPRRGKQRRRKLPMMMEAIEKQQPWAPTDSETDPEKELRLMQKMQICIRKLENSDFYRTFVEQIQTPEVLDHFHRVLASESKMLMVIYGIGSIDSYEPPRFQLALAILIKRRFDWIGEIEVFDPILSMTESMVLKALGCSVLSVNEQGRREALKPTLFFMPHCEAVLYDNLLQVNWQAKLLNHMIVFGNSFKRYELYVSELKNSTISYSAKHVLSVGKFANEVGIETVSDDFFRAFHDSSWHFFNLDPEMDLELQSIIKS